MRHRQKSVQVRTILLALCILLPTVFGCTGGTRFGAVATYNPMVETGDNPFGIMGKFHIDFGHSETLEHATRYGVEAEVGACCGDPLTLAFGESFSADHIYFPDGGRRGPSFGYRVGARLGAFGVGSASSDTSSTMDPERATETEELDEGERIATEQGPPKDGLAFAARVTGALLVVLTERKEHRSSSEKGFNFPDADRTISALGIEVGAGWLFGPVVGGPTLGLGLFYEVHFFER